MYQWVILAGRDRPKGVTTKCRAGGAGILLSAAATQSWKDGGSWVRRYGGDIVAIRVKAHNRRGRSRNLFLVSAYAPDSSKPPETKRRHWEQLLRCVNDARCHEMLIVGTDANVRLGSNAMTTLGHMGRQTLGAQGTEASRLESLRSW